MDAAERKAKGMGAPLGGMQPNSRLPAAAVGAQVTHPT